MAARSCCRCGWLSHSPTHANAVLAEVAIIALGVNAYILVLVMGSPVFNTQLGILFWTVAGALHGATRSSDPWLQLEQPYL